MSWINYGLTDRPSELDPQAGETPADHEARIAAYIAANPGELTPLNAATIEDALEYTYDKAVADATGTGSQPLDSDLTAIAALSTTSFGRNLLTLADAAAGRTALGLGTAATSASTAFQASDSDLTAIAALTTTTFGRALLELADAAAGRTALGVEASGTSIPKSTVTTAGDLIVATGNAAVTRLAKGTDGQVLKMSGGSVAWGTDSTDVGGDSAPRIVGTIGAAITTQTITFSGAEEVWLIGTAATATVTLASRTAGASLLILAVLDSVTRTITISDGSGGTQAFTLPATASGATLGIIEARCPNSTDIAAAVGTGSTSGAETDPNAILKSIIDAAGDLIVGTADNTAGRLAKGADGQILTMVSGSVAWANASSGFSNPMTTSGDIIKGGSSGAAARLAIGSTGQVLTVSGGAPVWADPDATQTELDAKADKTVTINAQIGTTYTLVLGDASKLVTVSNASTHTLTVPPNSGVAFAVGTVINVSRIGAGAVNIAAGVGVTVSSPDGALGLRAQYSQATLIKTATNTWLLGGDIA